LSSSRRIEKLSEHFRNELYKKLASDNVLNGVSFYTRYLLYYCMEDATFLFSVSAVFHL